MHSRTSVEHVLQAGRQAAGDGSGGGVHEVGCGARKKSEPALSSSQRPPSLSSPRAPSHPHPPLPKPHPPLPLTPMRFAAFVLAALAVATGAAGEPL